MLSCSLLIVPCACRRSPPSNALRLGLAFFLDSLLLSWRRRPGPCLPESPPIPLPPPSSPSLSHPASESVASAFLCAVTARGSGRVSHTRPCARIKSAPSHRWLRIASAGGRPCPSSFQVTRTSSPCLELALRRSTSVPCLVASTPLARSSSSATEMADMGCHIINDHATKKDPSARHHTPRPASLRTKALLAKVASKTILARTMHTFVGHQIVAPCRAVIAVWQP